jgi:hypothetical protein
MTAPEADADGDAGDSPLTGAAAGAAWGNIGGIYPPTVEHDPSAAAEGAAAGENAGNE